ncbi:hypothetical protein ON010_g16104 [Phytophthora cinnamomi]|nr:hypothetical protein ON010_g16104 [Phytophthora cinnamomi]
MRDELSAAATGVQKRHGVQLVVTASRHLDEHTDEEFPSEFVHRDLVGRLDCLVIHDVRVELRVRRHAAPVPVGRAHGQVHVVDDDELTVDIYVALEFSDVVLGVLDGLDTSVENRRLAVRSELRVVFALAAEGSDDLNVMAAKARGRITTGVMERSEVVVDRVFKVQKVIFQALARFVVRIPASEKVVGHVLRCRSVDT